MDTRGGAEVLLSEGSTEKVGTRTSAQVQQPDLNVMKLIITRFDSIK